MKLGAFSISLSVKDNAVSYVLSPTTVARINRLTGANPIQTH